MLFHILICLTIKRILLSRELSFYLFMSFKIYDFRQIIFCRFKRFKLYYFARVINTNEVRIDIFQTNMFLKGNPWEAKTVPKNLN